jgi:DNA-binding NtrC family response regulator
LPGMSGTELARQISESKPQIRVIYMSGHAGPHSANPAGLMPNAALLQKPFGMRTLLRQLRSVLGQTDHPRPSIDGRTSENAAANAAKNL